MTSPRSGGGVSPELAFRVAKVVGVSITDLLLGHWPEKGVCPKCGYKDELAAEK